MGRPDGSFIDIDKAYVYPNTSDGWVRVKGKDNFQQAFKHLNGGVLDYKSIIAFDRNDEEEVMLRDPAPAAPSTRRDRGGSDTPLKWDLFQASSYGCEYLTSPVSSYTTSKTSNDCYCPANLISFSSSPIPPPFSNGCYPQPSSKYERPNSFEYAFTPTTPGIVYADNMAPFTPVYLPPPLPMITYMAPLPYADNPLPLPVTPTHPISSSYRFSHSSSFPTPQQLIISTIARKLIITRLPHTITTNELYSLLLKTLSKSPSCADLSDAIQSVDIQRRNDQKPKGHAFTIFDSYEDAKFVVEKLNGYRWRGRELQIKFTKEGVEMNERQRSVIKEADANRGPITSQMPRSCLMEGGKSKSADDKHANDKRLSATSDNREKTKRKEKRYRTKPCKPTKLSSETYSTPMVVDGSSHRCEF